MGTSELQAPPVRGSGEHRPPQTMGFIQPRMQTEHAIVDGIDRLDRPVVSGLDLSDDSCQEKRH